MPPRQLTYNGPPTHTCSRSKRPTARCLRCSPLLKHTTADSSKVLQPSFAS